MASGGVGKEGWRGVGEGLGRGWGRVGEGVGEGLGRGLENGWGRVGRGLDFLLFENPVCKPLS